MGNRTDAFTRADSNTTMGTPTDGGSDWEDAAGTWGIQTNAGAMISATAQGTIVLESSVADVDVQCTIPVLNSDMGIIARETDSSNYLMFAAIAGGVGWKLYKRVAGTFTQLGSTATGNTANGDVLKITANGTSVTGYVNGVSKVAVTESFNLTATKHGIRANSDVTTRFDTFSITSLVVGGILQKSKGMSGGMSVLNGGIDG